MTIFQMLYEAFESLISNKLRSGLTMLGIVIGVAAVIAMLAIGAGAQASIDSSINSIGSNLIFITAGGSSNVTNPKPLTTADADAIKANVPEVSLVSAVLQGRIQVSASGQSSGTTVMAVGPDYAQLRNLAVTEGSFITGEQMTQRAAVVVLAELKSPAAQHALHKCLRHPDDRVRANALDAMARAARRGGWIGSTDSPLGKAVVEFGDDPHHRVRAGAARARAMAAGRGQGGGVGPIVVPLLRDERAMHRVSGLWLAERVAGDGEVARTIAEMVRSDPSPEVRVRARRTAGRMLAGMGR